MHSDISKKARITIQDFKLPIRDHCSASLPRQGQGSRNSIKKSILVFMNTQRRYKRLVYQDDDYKTSTQPKPFLEISQSIRNEFPAAKILNLPQQSFQEYTQGTQTQNNPQQKLQTYTSVKLNRPIYNRAQKYISDKYPNKKVETIKQYRMPIISQPLFTISHFTDALNSIPNHSEISTQKLRILKKPMIHIAEVDRAKRQADSPQIPQQLRTLRMVKKTSQDKSSSSIMKSKFRTVLVKKPSKKEEAASHDIYKIQGWKQQKRYLFD